jgi:hypothetical protein
MAKKPIEPTTEPATPADGTRSVPATLPDLALRICARTGMGLTICRERMAGNEDKLAELLASNDTPGILALLEPSNKA